MNTPHVLTKEPIPRWPGAREATKEEPPISIAVWKNKVLDTMGLTIKEREVANLILQGFSTKEMAEILGNTEKTLKHHIATIYHKADVGSRSEFFAEIFCI